MTAAPAGGASTHSRLRKNAISAILAGGLTAGAVDFTYATTFYYAWRKITPKELWQYVASGAIGSGASEGGNWTMALGITLHFAIACLMAAAFVLISRRAQVLLRHVLVSGLLYGIFLYYFMNGVVLPLSNVPAAPDMSNFPMIGSSALNFAGGLLVHVLGVAIPIAIFARRNLLNGARSFH